VKTKTFLSIFNAIETVLNNAVRMIVNIFTFAITEMAPMVAPLPPAFSIYRAMDERLHVPFYVSVIAAVAIEIIGMFSSKVSIRCYQWNATRNKTDAAAPQALSILMTAAYFLVVLLLALTVELLPSLTALIIPGFVIIAISVYINLAIHTNLEKLEIDKAANLELREERNGLSAQIRQAKKELSTLTGQYGEVIEQVKMAKRELSTLGRELASQEQQKTDLILELERLEKQAKMAQNAQIDYPNTVPDLAKANETKQDKIIKRRERLANLIAQDNTLTIGQLAKQLGVSAGTVKNDKKALNGLLKVEGV